MTKELIDFDDRAEVLMIDLQGLLDALELLKHEITPTPDTRTAHAAICTVITVAIQKAAELAKAQARPASRDDLRDLSA